jgi:hypothetical protein
MWLVYASQNVLKVGKSELFSTFFVLLALYGVYRFFVEVSLSRIFDKVHAFRFIIMLYKWYLQRDLK